MSNPFIDTTLYTTIALHPRQLNNDIYINLKQTLIRQLEGKCYKNYGFISKIYEILERDNGFIVPEDTLSSAVFKIKFSCRLCHPIENTQIVCQIDQISNVFIRLRHDPIQIIVTNDLDRIKSDLFSLENNVLKYKKTNEILEKGQFVKTTILGKTFTDKDKRIIVIGTIDDIASDDDISLFYKQEYDKEKNFIEFDNYVDGKSNIPNEKKQTIEQTNTSTNNIKTSESKVKQTIKTEDKHMSETKVKRTSETEDKQTGGSKVKKTGGSKCHKVKK